MAANAARLNVQVNYNVNQASVNALKKSLQDLQKVKVTDFKGTSGQLREVIHTAEEVERALNKAFNVKLNSLNTQQFINSLQRIGGGINDIYTKFSSVGAKGQVAFSQVARAAMTTNVQLKETHSLINSMGQTMMNTVKWGIASSIMNQFTGAVKNAFSYVKSLDSALTDIRIVTGDSTEQMKQFAVQANNAAQALGRSTMDYTKAALTFYQQGLDDQSVQARTEATLKAQNITGAGDQMADYLTAVWNGYRVANEEAQLYVDKLAAVADSSASNMSQLAVAMSKVASTARAMGVDVDSLNAQIATIVGTTRQAPESVGNALKTIYARINDIATGADDAQVSLGNYSQKMAQVGFSVLDANGNLRDTGQVIDQIGGKWQTLSREQQIYLARTMAGQRQYNNLIALFDNWGRYTDLVNVSLDSQGTLMQKNSRYMDSLEAKMQQFSAAGERVKSALINEEDLKGLTSFGTNVVNVFASLIQGIGGARGAILNFGSIFAGLFSNVISKQINNLITNMQNAKNNAQILKEDIEATELFAGSKGYKTKEDVAPGIVSTVQEMTKAKKAAQQYYDVMNQGQINSYNNIVNEIGAAKQQTLLFEQQQNKAQKYIDLLKNKTKLGLEASLEDVQGAAQQALDRLNEIKISSERMSGAGGQSRTQFNELKNQVQQLVLAAGGKQGSTAILQGTQGWKKYQEAIEGVGNRGAVSEKVLLQVRSAIKQMKQQLQQGFQGVVDFDQTTEGLKQAQAQLELGNQKAKQFLQSIAQFSKVKATVNMVAGLGQLAASLNNVINLTKVWKNTNLSTSQKILQTFTTLSMTLGQVVSGYNKISDSIKKVVKGAMAKLALDREEAIAQEAKNIAETTGITLDQAAAVAATEHGAAQLTLSAALKQVAADAWAAMAPLLPFIALAAAVGVAIYGIYKEWNKEADAAKKANQVAASTKKRFEEVKQAYDDLKQSLEDYNAAQEAIDSMTKGTQQWADAIQQANDNVLQLLNNYPLLAQYISTGQDGRLIISQAGQDAVLNYQQQAVNYARLASSEAARDARDASARATAAAIGHNSYFTEQMQDGTYQGQFATAEAVENVIKHLDDLKFEEGDLQNHLSDAADQMAVLAGISKEQAQAILENSDQLFKLKRTMQENEKATQLAYKALAGQALSDNQYYSNSDAITQDAMSTMLGKTLDASTKKLQDDWEQKLTENIAIWSGAGNQYVQEMLDKFNQANSTNWGLASNAVRGTDTNRSFAFINEQGQQVVYTKEQIAATIAAKQALEGLGQSAKNVQKMFNQLQNIGQGNEAQAIKNLIAGRDLSSMTETEINALNFDTDQFAEYFDRYKEQFNQLGYKTVDELTKVANTLKDSSLEKLKNITNGYGKSVQNAFKDLNLSGFGYSVQKQVIDTLNEAFVKGKGLKGFQTTVANVLQDALDAGRLEDLLNQDFSNMDLDTLKETLSKLGIATDASDKALKIFLNTMKKIPELTAQEIYNNVHSIIDKKSGKTLEYNDQLSEEDYNKLKQAGVAVDNAFVRLTSGMYKFVGDAEQFYNKANQVSLKPFFDQIDEVREKINLVGNGFSYEDLSKQSYQLQPGTTQKIVTTVDYNLVQQQVDALKATDLISDEDFAKYNDLIKLQQMDYESLQQIQSQIQNNSQRVGEYAENAKKAYQEDLHAQQVTLAYSQQDLGELRNLRNATDDEGNGYLDTLSLEEYKNAILAVADAEGIVKENVEALGQLWANEADTIDNVDDKLKDNKAMTYVLAAAMEDLVVGVQAIQKSWKQTISEGVEPSAQVIEQTRAALSDMFNVPVDSTFIQDNLNIIRQLAIGNMDAIGQLQTALINARLAAQQFSEDAKVQIQASLGWDDFDQGLSELQALIAGSSDYLNTIQIGTNIEEAPFYDALDRFVQAAGFTQEQINQLFGMIGYEPEVQYKTIDSFAQVHGTQETGYYINTQLGDGSVIHSEVTQEQYNDLLGGNAIQVPVIKPHSFTYRGGGNRVKDYGGSRVTPKAPKTTSPKGGKSGGGSSKKPTQAKLAEAKNSKENEKQKVRDPYEQVQKAYERQEQLLDNLQDKEKKLLDRDRVKLLKEQAEELRKQNQIIQERLDISNSAKGDIWKTDPKTTLEYRKWLQANLGARFDDDGRLASRTAAENKAIQNYNKALADADARYNKQIDSYNKWITNVYNKASAERQQQLKALKEKKDAEKQRAEENHKTDLKNAEELYKKSIDNLNNYQKKWQDDQKDRKTQRQNDWKAYQNLIESSRIQIKLKVDSGQLERDWLDFEKKFIKKVSDDDILGNAKHSIKELMSYIDSGEIAARNKVIEDIRKSIENIQAGGVDDLYGQNIVKAREDLDALIKDQQDDLLKIQDIVDEVKNDYLDMIDKANDKMQQQVDQYERVNSLIDHDVKLLELIYGDKGLETRQKYYELQKANNQQELDSLKKQQDYWRERMSQQVIGSDAWNKFKQNLDDVTDDLNSKLENMIDERTKQWQNSVNIIINNLNNSLTNGLGTNFLDEQWDYMSDFDDKFLDTFNSTVGVQDVERLYNQALEGVAGNPKAQQRINNLMKEQLKILKEKDNLTQYDLERAKAMLQVEQARMDLEDARNNKTKMRLRRDSQGNYTYQYVADEEKLTDLQQALADAQTNLYNMDKDHYKQNLEDMNQAYKDFLGKQQQLQDELARAMAAGDEAEAERVRNRLNLLEQSYDKMYSALLEDNQYLLDYLGSSFADGMGIDRAAQSAEQFAQTMKENIPYVASSIQNMVNNIRDLGGLLPATAGAITGIADAANAWQQDVNKTLETAGTSASDIMNVTDAEGKALDNNIQTTRELITANDALIASTKLEIEAIQELLSNMDDILAKNFQFDELVKNLREAYNLAQTLYGSTVTADQIPVAQNNVDTTFNSPEDAKAYYTTLAERAQEKFDSGELLVDNDIAQILSDRLKNNQITTEELADLIKVSEYIQSITSSMGNLFSHEITSLDSGIGEILSTTTSENGTIDQNVHIDANFPNVTDHNQIEQAFNNLVNIASMYASKRY